MNKAQQNHVNIGSCEWGMVSLYGQWLYTPYFRQTCKTYSYSQVDAKVIREWHGSTCIGPLEIIEVEWYIYMYVSVNRTLVGSDNGLLPVRRQSITWSNAVILLIWPLGLNFSEIWIKNYHSRTLISKRCKQNGRPIFTISTSLSNEKTITGKGMPFRNAR